MPCQAVFNKMSLDPIPDELKVGDDTGCFRHQYTDFVRTYLGVPKFNL